jgi:hypothetical protein
MDDLDYDNAPLNEAPSYSNEAVIVIAIQSMGSGFEIPQVSKFIPLVCFHVTPTVGWQKLHYSKPGKVCKGALTVELQTQQHGKLHTSTQHVWISQDHID